MKEPYEVFEDYDAEKEAKLSSLPECDMCGERIQDESYHSIFGECICDSCLDNCVIYTDI